MKVSRVSAIVGACSLVLLVAGTAAAQDKSTTVSALGQAAIYGDDASAARDRAIDDALRKAVEQALGAMVSSETVTENFQLISDKILSNSKGYVRKYKILSEGKDSGVYQVKIEAEVSQGDLKGDLDGILAVLKAKNMPRVMVMVSEQNVGQAGASFWWGNKTFSTNLDAVENTFVDAWKPKGFKFVDRQGLQGNIQVAQAMGSAEPSQDAVKSFGLSAGAEVVIYGKAVATDVGPIMGTQMHSIRGNISIRALNLDTSEIIATSTQTQAVGHIDPTTGGTQALQKVARKAAKDMLGKILATWQKETTGAGGTISLSLRSVKKSRHLRQISRFIRDQVRGVSDVRQRSFRNKNAELEVDMKGSAEDLAIELEEKKFPGFEIEINEITANTVKAAVNTGK